MKITKRLLIGAVVVLALAAVAAPVIAASEIVVLVHSSLEDEFRFGDCRVETVEVSTEHHLFNRHLVTTSIGEATVTGSCEVEGFPIQIPTDPPLTVPYAVVNLRNSRLDVATKAYAQLVLLPSDDSLPLDFDAAGASARLIRLQGKERKYLGYAYAYPSGGEGYLKVPFVAVGNPEAGYDLQVPAP